MEVRLQPEKEAQLAQIAAQRGLAPDALAQQVLSRYLEDDTISSRRLISAWPRLRAESSLNTRKWAGS
jgi:hypothetical protein